MTHDDEAMWDRMWDRLASRAPDASNLLEETPLVGCLPGATNQIGQAVPGKDGD
jgi:hypothetical protein